MKHKYDFIIYLNYFTDDVNARGVLMLKRTMDFGKTYQTLLSHVYSFGFAGRFLFASVVNNQVR